MFIQRQNKKLTNTGILPKKKNGTLPNTPSANTTNPPTVSPPPKTREEQIQDIQNRNQNIIQKGREEGRKYGEEVTGRNYPGFNPEEKNALQAEANQLIKNQYQTANRQLLSNQGQRGIMGNSGIAQAQQRDLMKTANQAQAQSQRDLGKQNADLARQRLAQVYAIEQGGATEGLLNRQMAQDELEMADERQRQQELEDLFKNEYFKSKQPKKPKMPSPLDQNFSSRPKKSNMNLQRV